MKPSFVPKDIAEYEERIAFGLTARQMLWGGIAIASGLSFYCLTTLVCVFPM
uniref:PrgI family protein n=1 Tax=Faecalibaculum rodentium TaxID=1702221 RepID=UPI0034E87AB8